MKDQTLQKLTAYADGALDPRERLAIERLLAIHPEMRDALRGYQQDADRLKSLPRMRAPADLRDRILARIPFVDKQTRARNASAKRPVPWRWYAAAASIVLAIGIGSHWLLQDLLRTGNLQRANNALAVSKAQGSSGEGVASMVAPRALDQGSLASSTPAESHESSHPNDSVSPFANSLHGSTVASKAENQGDRPGDASADASKDTAAPAPKLPFTEPTYLTSPMLGQTKKFKTMDLKLPPIVDLRTARLDELIEGLDRDNLYHFDLACNENAKALERFQAACQLSGIRLLIDAEVTQRLARRIPTPCMAYLENVRGDVVTRLLTSMRDLDLKAEEARRGDNQFESLFIQTLDEAGRKRVADALGVMPSTMNPPMAIPRTGQPLDPSKPLSNDTLKALEQQAAGQGTGKPTTTTPPTIVLMTYYPIRNRATVAKDVKQHLEGRRGWQSDALHVVFYLRANKP